MKLLDYLFYRIHDFYKRNKDATPKYMSSLLLSMFIFLTILNFYGLVTLLFKIRILAPIKVLAFLSLMVILLVVWRRYRKDEMLVLLTEKYAQENTKLRHIRGIYIFGYLVLMLVLVVISGTLRQG